MRRFQRGEIDVLIATTVIEVGVDVPNATMMVIEHAERFGLAQIHQLRGRVGRGAAKSYCILMTGGKISPQAEERLAAMVRTQNGFELAELDLQLRGPGEFFGTRQAGLPGFPRRQPGPRPRSAGAGQDRSCPLCAKSPGRSQRRRESPRLEAAQRCLAAPLRSGGSRLSPRRLAELQFLNRSGSESLPRAGQHLQLNLHRLLLHRERPMTGALA